MNAAKSSTHLQERAEHDGALGSPDLTSFAQNRQLSLDEVQVRLGVDVRFLSAPFHLVVVI